MRQLAISALSNQDISSDLLVYTYTADAARTVLFRVAIDQISGAGGDYSFYLMLQALGAGSFYKSHVATVTAAAGVTAIFSPTVSLPVNNTDVARIYVKGLAGDTTTPDVTTWVFEQVYSEQMDLVDAPNATAITAIQSGLAVPGDEMALTTSERSSIVSAVWNALTSAMTTVGSIGNLLVEKLTLLVAGSITISVPVLPNGNARTIQGDDYLLEDGRALEWAISTTADLPDAEIAVILGGLTTFEAELVGDNTVRLELTRTETAAIPVGNHDFAIVATQDDGDVITLLEGRWRSTRRIVAP